MENNNNLEMGLFGEDLELELNLGLNPEDLEGEEGDTPPAPNPDENNEPEGNPPVPDNINPNEDGNPEDVVGDEGDNGGGEDVTSPNLYSSFASTLHDKGVLPSFDLSKSKIEDTDSLATVIKGEIDSQVKQYLVNKIGEEGVDALEKGISLAQYQEHTQDMLSLENITDEVLEKDLDTAKRVILQDYMNQGLSEVRSKRILQKTIDLGDEAILEDAKESIQSLKTFEVARIEQEKVNNTARLAAETQKQEKIDNDLKNAIYNRKEFIKGMPSNKTVQDRVYKAITEVVGESPQGMMENQLMKDRRENPIDFDAKLYYLYEITNGFEDFSKITTKASSKAATDFEKVLRQTKFDEAGSPAFIVDKDTYDGIGSELML